MFGGVNCFLAVWAVDRYGPRWTALFIGIFTGLSLLLTSQTSALWQLFITYSLLFSVAGAVYTTIMSTVSVRSLLSRSLGHAGRNDFSGTNQAGKNLANDPGAVLQGY